MIIKTYPNRNLYGKYFLATEAPDDEEVTEEQPKPKRNVKVISVKRSNRGKDFAQIEDDPVEEPVPEETTEPIEDTEVDNTDFTADADTGDDVEPVENEETPATEETPAEPVETTGDEDPAEDVGEETDFTADADTGEEPTPEETDGTTETIDVSAEDTGEDNTDFTADAGEETAPTEETPPAQDNTSATNNNAPGVDLDSMRKYNLFKEFMSLYNACDNYISKLETVLKNDYEENQIIRISVNNLREIRDIISDYMTIRFRLNSYIQSLLFHQKMVAAVQLIFNMLKSIKSNNPKTN
jgi:hypothetical protein